MPDPNLTLVSSENLLQEGVSSALAVLSALEGAGMLHNLPAGHHEAALHNHGLHLLSMLEESLRRIQAEVDARAVGA